MKENTISTELNKNTTNEYDIYNYLIRLINQGYEFPLAKQKCFREFSNASDLWELVTDLYDQ